MKVRAEKILVVILLIGFSVSSFALNVENYFVIGRHVGDSGETGAGARRTIEFYEQGLADAFRLVATMNDNKISFGGKSYICPPSADVITRGVVSSAIMRIIGSAERQKYSSPEELHTSVAQPAVIGLAQMFPCAK